MDTPPQPLSYAARSESGARTNWPAIGSVVCALVPPLVYALYIYRFSLKSDLSRWVWLINVGWGLSGGAATLLGTWGTYEAIRRCRRQRIAAILGLVLGIGNAIAFPLLRQYHVNRFHHFWGTFHKMGRVRIEPDDH